MRFKAVLFDLDGTLLDTLADIAGAANRALQAHGLPTHPTDDYRFMVGDGARNLVFRMLPADRRDESTVEECYRAYRAEYARSWNVRTRPYPGIEPMLDEVHSRGLRLAVLSNKPHDFTVKCVEHYLSRWPFAAVLGATSDFAHKPDPGSALHIAQQLEIPPQEFIYLGDTATDMQTAVNAGMYPAGVLWGFRLEQELRDSGAKSLLAEPRDLVNLLEA